MPVLDPRVDDLAAAPPAAPRVSDVPESQPLPAAAPSVVRRLVSTPELPAHLAMLAVAVCWGWFGVDAEGGRGHWSTIAQTGLVGVAALLLRSWRRVPLPHLLTATALGSAAVLVCAVTPTGWSGATAAASYVDAAGVFVCVVAWARTDVRRMVVLLAILAAGLEEFRLAFLPWWGSRLSTTQLIGTFYWHNPFAAFYLPITVLALGLLLSGPRALRPAGIAVFAVGVASVTLSTSRASMGVLAVTLAAVAAGALVLGVGGGRAQVLRRLAAAAVAAGILTVGICGPPFFPAWHSPLAATASRAAGDGQSAANNGAARLSFDKQSLAVISHHTLTGGGYGSFAMTSPGLARAPEGRATIAHNGLLETFDDGGLLFGLPMTAAVVAVGAGTFRRVRRRAAGARPGPLVVWPAVALAPAVVHSLMDFDWTYPTNLMLAAALAALVLSHPAPATGPTGPTGPTASTGTLRPRWQTWVALAVAGAAVVTQVVAGVATYRRTASSQLTFAARHGALVTDPGALAAYDHTLFHDEAPANAVLQLFVDDRASLGTRADALADEALASTAHLATVDRSTRLLRDRVAALRGDRSAAVADVEATIASLGPDAGPYAAQAADALAAAGARDRAEALLLHYVEIDLGHLALARTTGSIVVHAGSLIGLDPGSELSRCTWAALAPADRVAVAHDVQTLPGAPTAPCTAPVAITAGAVSR